MTALNNALRDKIIDSVILKGTTIPKRKEQLKKDTEARVRLLCLERVPKDFAAATKNLPPEWFPIEAYASFKAAVNPVMVMDMNDEELRKKWNTAVSFEPFRHPMNARFTRNDWMDKGFDNSDRDNPVKRQEDMESWEARLGDLLTVAKKIKADEDEARNELRQFLFSVKTYKQVIEKMPELEKHLPDYQKPMPLTVSVGPILKTLGKLGFDQSQPTSAP